MILLILAAAFTVALILLATIAERYERQLSPRMARALSVACGTLLVGSLACFVCLGFIACSATQTSAAVATVEDVSDAVCQELGANLQNEPEWLQFVCTKIDQKGQTHTFKVKLSTASAKRLSVPPASSSTGKVAP